MKRILKYLREVGDMFDYAFFCMDKLAAYEKPRRDCKWSDDEIAHMMKSQLQAKPFTFNKITIGTNHEKPTPNPYATYLCISSNS
jgi:hypothetical protein